MKRDSLYTGMVAAVLAFFTAWGAVGCLLSAFDLALQRSNSPVLICGAFAVGAALLLTLRHGGIILLCLVALMTGYIRQDGTALLQMKHLISIISTVYDRAYGWGVLDLSSDLPQAGFSDWPLWIWGSLIAMTVCRGICRRKSVWLPVLVTLLPLCSCIVVTDTVPDEPFLLMVMAGLILLMLTSSVRQENAAQGNRLTAAASLPVILALGGLFLAVPKESYVNQNEVFRENILTAAENLPQLLESGMGQLASGLQVQPPKLVDLAALGDRIPFTYPVMEVTAETSGTLYLRGQDYDRYDGRGWTVSENRTESFSSAAGRTEFVRIRTRTGKMTRYLPYHPASLTELVNGFAENPGRKQEYTLLRAHLPDNWRQTACGKAVGSATEWQAYLSLPEATRQGAAGYLEHLYNEDASYTEKADMIAAFVTDSACYNTRPGKMPAGEPDFALWFLREGDSGYCVHFATAATVLLRAAGVPARYVTGYLLETAERETVTVTEENAHAWAEYYEPNLGIWLPLEATPASETTLHAMPPAAAAEAAETTAAEESIVPEAEPVTDGTLQAEMVTTETLSGTEATPERTSSGHFGVFLILPGGILLLVLQRSIRLAVRRRYQRAGSPNRQALRRWQEAVRLARILKDSPTEELIVLAQKARFSQYELTSEELQQFDSFQRTCLRRLREKPGYLRLIYKYIYAVW